QTSDKLRRLVALMAQTNVLSIDVICLLNRMGRLAGEFVARIKRMTSGLGSSRPEGSFRFFDLYHVVDLNGQDLMSTHESIQRLPAYYSNRTQSDAFKSLIVEEMRYFRILPFPNWRSDQADDLLPTPRRVEYRDGEEQVSVKVKTRDALIYALHAEAQAGGYR